MARRKSSALEAIEKEKFELQMTPMIDVTFLLLIFFMCTIKFKLLEGKLSAYLPKDVGVNSEPAPPRDKIEVEIVLLNEGTKVDARKPSIPYDGKGRFAFSDDRRVNYKIGPDTFSTVEQVRQALVNLRAARPDDTPVMINPRPGIVNKEVIHVLDAALAANFEEVSFKGAGGGVGK